MGKKNIKSGITGQDIKSKVKGNITLAPEWWNYGVHPILGYALHKKLYTKDKPDGRKKGKWNTNYFKESTKSG